MSLTVTIENDNLVIRIPAETMAMAVKFMPKAEIFDAELQDFFGPEITDSAAFLKEMLAALENEEEDGTTLVHRMLDKAAQQVMHVGGEGVISAQEVAEKRRAIAKAEVSE